MVRRKKEADSERMRGNMKGQKMGERKEFEAKAFRGPKVVNSKKTKYEFNGWKLRREIQMILNEVKEY